MDEQQLKNECMKHLAKLYFIEHPTLQTQMYNNELNDYQKIQIWRNIIDFGVRKDIIREANINGELKYVIDYDKLKEVML
jgi:hypothetical protein